MPQTQGHSHSAGPEIVMDTLSIQNKHCRSGEKTPGLCPASWGQHLHILLPALSEHALGGTHPQTQGGALSALGANGGDADPETN